jgi:transposase
VYSSANSEPGKVTLERSVAQKPSFLNGAGSPFSSLVCSLNDNPFGGGQSQPRLRDYSYYLRTGNAFYLSFLKLLIMKEKKNAFPVIQPEAAGIDISSKEHYVAVNPARDIKPVRCFGAFTEDLHAIAEWLKQCKVSTVAMEATGIYWVSLFLVLEEAGFEVLLVNARHVKNVRGKKTDMSDAEWIRQLHSCGLLSASFQPDEFTRTLRTYMRHRKNLLQMAATHIRMMQKAMEQMNLKLQHVIADITGKSGQAIIEAILLGERDPEKLVTLLDGRIKANTDDVRRSLQGVWREENIFELRQCFEMYRLYRSKILECDKHIEELLVQKAGPQSTGNEAKKQTVKSNKNNLHFHAKDILQHITGTDLTEVFGINDSTAVEIISETGLDMNKWPTAKHFTAWLNLAPNNKISGGKILSTRIPKKKNRAGQVFKLAAYAVQRSKNWLAMFFHRIKVKAGVKKAITATARKIAVIFYTMLKEKIMFAPIAIESYQESFRERQIKRIERQAKNLGLQLVQK